MNAWTIFGLRRIGGVHAVDPEIRPDRRQAAERLAAREPIAAFDALGLRRREQHRDVVAALGVPGGEHLASRGGLEQPSLRPVAGAPEIGGDAGPVQVHVDRERRRRGVVAEPPLLLRDAGQRQAGAAELGRNGEREDSRPGASSSKSSEKNTLSRSYCGARFANRASISSVRTVCACRGRGDVAWTRPLPVN